MTARTRRFLGALAAFGSLGIVVVVWRTDLRDSLRSLRGVGWPVLLAFPLYLGWNLSAARGWRALFVGTPAAGIPSTCRLLSVRLATQIVALGLPAGAVAAGMARAVLATGARRLPVGLSAVSLDSLVDGVVGITFFALGSLIAIEGWGSHAGWVLSGVVVAAGLAAVLWHARRLAALALRLLGLRGGQWRDTLQRLSDAGPALRGAVARAAVWHLLERLLMCCEILAASWALGAPLTPWTAVFATAWMTGIGLMFCLVPGQAGANEAGLLIAFQILGLPASTALAIALLRRCRQVIVAALGAPILALLPSAATTGNCPAEAKPERTVTQ